MPRGRWSLRKGADAHADHLEPMLVGIQAAKVLPTSLADPIEAVGPDRQLWADALASVVEACDVEAAGEHDPSAALLASGLVDVVGADDVGLQDAVEAVLVGDASQVNGGIDIVHGLRDRLQVTNIGGEQLLARPRSTERGNVQQAQGANTAVESLAKDPTDRAGCPGDEDTVHTSLPLLGPCSPGKATGDVPGSARASSRPRCGFSWNRPRRRVGSRQQRAAGCQRRAAGPARVGLAPPGAANARTLRCRARWRAEYPRPRA